MLVGGWSVNRLVSDSRRRTAEAWVETASGKKRAEVRSTIAATAGVASGKQENSETVGDSYSPEQSQEKHPMVSGKNDRGSGARSQGIGHDLHAGSDYVRNHSERESDRLHQCDRCSKQNRKSILKF